MAEASQQRLEVTQKETSAVLASVAHVPETRAAPQHRAFPLRPRLLLTTALQPCGSAKARPAKTAELSWRTRRTKDSAELSWRTRTKDSATFQPIHATQVMSLLSLQNVTG